VNQAIIYQQHVVDEQILMLICSNQKTRNSESSLENTALSLFCKTSTVLWLSAGYHNFQNTPLPTGLFLWLHQSGCYCALTEFSPDLQNNHNKIVPIRLKKLRMKNIA